MKTRMRGAIASALGLASLFLSVLAAVQDCSAGGGASTVRTDEGTVRDVDGNIYRTVAIGTQVWMGENLRVTRYRDGAAIPRVTADDEWSRTGTGAYCLPERDPACDPCDYGLLYNFHAVRAAGGLCPQGWHVPSAEEWRTLISHLGGPDVAGGKMKDTGSGLWRTTVPGTISESGFSALPAGGRGSRGSAGEAGYFATWWSRTSHDPDYAWHWGLYPDESGIRYNPGHKGSGFSVRCVKD